jgi:methionyl-tRNA formyltransferase
MAADRRIVYAGTPEFAVPALAALIESGRAPVAVYTQPDRPAGRGRKLTASPVKQLAQAAGIPVLQPPSLRPAEARAELAALAPELLIVAAYGLILPRSVLAIPPLGGLNIHASLLPRWRGAAPIQRAILAGDAQTGVCLMRMEPGLDTGPVFACERLALGPEATAASVHDQLAAMGARLLLQRLDAIIDGSLTPMPQSEEDVLYALKIDKGEAWIDWTESAAAIDRRVRAFNPWPVAQTRFGDRILRIHAARALPGEPGAGGAPPGGIVASRPDGVDVATGAGILRLLVVQMPGRRPIPAGAWAHGEDLAGRRLGGAG